MKERRRAIDARTRQIVEESDMLWALAHDQAKAEFETHGLEAADGSVEIPSKDRPVMLDLLVVWFISIVVLVPVGWVLGFVLFVSCGSMANVPCEDSAGLAWRLWLVLTLGSFLLSGILVYQRRNFLWAALPFLVGFLGALITPFARAVLL